MRIIRIKVTDKDGRYWEEYPSEIDGEADRRIEQLENDSSIKHLYYDVGVVTRNSDRARDMRIMSYAVKINYEKVEL